MRPARHPAVLAALLLLGCTAAPPPVRQAESVALAPDTSWVARSALYEVFVRSFSPTGDLRGVAAGLDRIAAAGADVVWLMPIHPVGERNRKGPLGSPYAVRDYRAINPDFGTEAEFRALVDSVHARGMKLILDWVPNHTAWDHEWITTHPDYYARNAAGGISVPRDEAGNLTDWTDVAELDYDNPALRRAMIDAMAWWIREFGIDGYRMDVAGFVPDDFWREALPALRAAAGRPIMLLAEWGDLDMHTLGFDLSYGWDPYSRLKATWDSAPAAAFVSAEAEELARMPPGGMRLRFTTNHDETAWDATPIERFGGVAGARAAFVAMALLPGRPLLYNGQEIEHPEQLRLFHQDPIDWRRAGADDARTFYRRVIDLARHEPAFLTGDFTPLATSAPDAVIAYRRGDAIVLVNVRPEPVAFTVRDAAVDGASDLLSGAVQAGGTVALPPHGAVVLTRRAAPSR